MLFQLNPSSSMIINRARLTLAAGETRDRVNDTNARRSSLVRLKTDCMLHIVLLKSMLHNTSPLLHLPRRGGEKRGGSNRWCKCIPSEIFSLLGKFAQWRQL